jgi:hypothetical protein
MSNGGKKASWVNREQPKMGLDEEFKPGLRCSDLNQRRDMCGIILHAEVVET